MHSSRLYFPSISAKLETQIVDDLLKDNQTKISASLQRIKENNQGKTEVAELENLLRTTALLHHFKYLCVPWIQVIKIIDAVTAVATDERETQFFKNLTQRSLEKQELQELIQSGQLNPFYEKMNHLGETLLSHLFEYKKAESYVAKMVADNKTIIDDEELYQKKAQACLKVGAMGEQMCFDMGLIDSETSLYHKEKYQKRLFAKKDEPLYSESLRYNVYTDREIKGGECVNDLIKEFKRFNQQLQLAKEIAKPVEPDSVKQAKLTYSPKMWHNSSPSDAIFVNEQSENQEDYPGPVMWHGF